MKIKQSYNNNIVLAINENGDEAIVVGTGIGFSKKFGDIVDETKIKKIYYSREDSIKKFDAEVLELANLDVLVFVERALEEIEEQLKITVYSSLFVSLVEHLNNLLQEGSYLEEEHPLRWIVKRVYPETYEISKQIYKDYCQQFKIEIPSSEVVAISLHIINGIQKNTMPDTLENTQTINEILRVLEFSGNFNMNKKDIDYSRFVTHLEFLLNRLRSNNKFSGEGYDTINLEIYQSIFTSLENDDRIMNILEKILMILRKKYGELSEAEKLFLLIHLFKLSS
ncbi:PRD domain-containing protein [Candidatus Enterococcus ferrettii]|uniref:Beta-glucoside operon transcriptional antiterminator n=1 Tax=Candidatus Enterococcus ferrettii TaxID=2815324 RepID=A0ABV0EUY7_9ENTE|nr:PRD domain-containing protein [Enterococcus sp. 665A]MBO1341685.1 PRD domain-containing protein [Enterococcus sp. 665A]